MGRVRHVLWPNKKTCILVIVINNEPILCSMLAAGILQDTFAGYVCWRSWRRRAREAKWRRLEATSTTWPVLTGCVAAV